MKRILIIFFILIGVYLIYTLIQNFPLLNDGNYTTSPISNSVEEIEIDVASLKLEIIPEKRDNIEVKFEGKGKVKLDDKRRKITIEHEQPFFNFFSVFNRSHLTVYIPEDYNRSLAVDMGSGSLYLSGSSDKPYQLKKLSVNMSSGHAELNHLNVDDFSYDVSSGNVVIHSLEAANGDFDVSSGNINIKNYVGAIDADISSGRFNLQLKELVDSIRVEVSSGNVDLDLPDDADFALNGRVSSGKISYDFPLTVEEHDGRTIKGKHQTGKYPIHVRVSSGNVKIH